MFTSENWQDYELLDTSDGERLERWGKYILVRPDPQVIWKETKKHPLWKKADATYHRSSAGGGGWRGNRLPEHWQIGYRGLTFLIRPMGFKHTGLFPEQAANWDWFSEKIKTAGRPVRVLNLFAYTGGGRGRSQCGSCGCGAEHGSAGQGKRAAFRSCRCADPIHCG